MRGRQRFANPSPVTEGDFALHSLNGGSFD